MKTANDYAIQKLLLKLKEETKPKRRKKIEKSLKYLYWSDKVLAIK